MAQQIAPFDACILCYRGDTNTVMVIRGEAEWHITAHTKLGISKSEALRLISEVTGCQPGMVPDGVFNGAIRLCTDCASKHEVTVVNQRDLDGEVSIYVQPDL